MNRGQYMRAARKKRGLSLRKLSELSGYHANTIFHLENNTRHGNIDTITDLADALGISIDEYVGHKRKGE
mgnify:CR=1 FL=1